MNWRCRMSSMRFLGALLVLLVCLGGAGCSKSGSYTDLEGPVTQAWVARYHGPGDNTASGQDLAVDEQGNVYVTGRSGVSNDNASFELFTLKYDSKGKLLWVKTYTAPAEGVALALDGSGNVVVTGYSTDSDTSKDYVTIKYSADGEQLWVQRYGAAGSDDEALGLAVDRSGNIVVTGYITDRYAGKDYATVKYSPDGEQLWVQHYDGAGKDDEASDLAIDGLGNVVVTGYSTGLETGKDYATVKYGPDGEQLWVQHYDGAGKDDGASDLAIDGSGSVVATGYSTVTDWVEDYATIKYGADGEQLWLQLYDGAESGDRTGNMAMAVGLDAAGRVYVTGASGGIGWSDFTTIKYGAEGPALWLAHYHNPRRTAHHLPEGLAIDTAGQVHVTGYAGYDYGTVKYDTDGNQVWSAIYSGPESGGGDHSHAIAVDGSGSAYVTGWAVSRMYGLMGCTDERRDYDCVTIKYTEP